MPDSPTDDGEGDLDINSFSLQGNCESDAEDQAILDINAISLCSESDLDRPATRSTDQPVAADVGPSDTLVQNSAEAKYHVRSLGHVLGPLTWDSLAEMVGSGSLSRGDEIQFGNGGWIYVEAIPGLLELIADEEPESNNPEPDQPENEQDASASPPKSSKGKPKPGRKKRRKKTVKEDAFLKEIFAEVFTEDGGLRQRDTAASKDNSATRAEPVHAASSGSAGFDSPAPFVAPSQQPAFTKSKPATPTFKKKSSHSSSFEMPEPRTLGIIAGCVITLGLVIGLSMGVISIPGTGVDAEPFFVKFNNEYATAIDSAESWKDFCRRNSAEAQNLVRAMGVSRTARAAQLQKAALLVMKITSEPFGEKDRINELFTEINDALQVK